MAELTRLVGRRRGVPVHEYPADPRTPPVSVVRFGHHELSDREHVHNFPALWYAREAGLVHLIAAGEIVDPTHIRRDDDGVGLFFDPSALGEHRRAPWSTWRKHPQLFVFLHERHGGRLPLELPADRRAVWDAAIEAIEAELAARRRGYREAALAHLTVLLIDCARLADEVEDGVRRAGDPLVAKTLAVIDRRHAEPLSLRDVARELAVSGGHLTTVMRRRTGRTVQDWITERRMAEARRLLDDPELPVGEVARRVGLPDQGYFARLFRKVHGVSPRSWREQYPLDP
ncbi:AraC family transcriptional regulator [Mycolicibacter terrae]|uniref:AraC family transcriptional regulator n=1 Tax=Mycolicibacter terrae TaxID=1788 RepID=A0ACD2EJT2_9MYCO|nr:AraC family transcriptional regulator [Mycolicibacter terrae]RRR42589.1 AraC family transcriptional regulator [Mycolicibacter terrae]